MQRDFGQASLVLHSQKEKVQETFMEEPGIKDLTRCNTFENLAETFSASQV